MSARNSDETAQQGLTPLAWVQLGPLVIETLLLMILFITLGVLCLGQTMAQLGIASLQHVSLLVALLTLFGSYRNANTSNAARLFISYLLSFLMAGFVFLLSIESLIQPAIDYRFDVFFLVMAFFMLNSVRPLIFNCSERSTQTPNEPRLN